MHYLPGGSYNPDSNRNGSSDGLFSLLGDLFCWAGNILSKLAEGVFKFVAGLAVLGIAIFLLWILYSSVAVALAALYKALAEIWSGFIPPTAFATQILFAAVAGAIIGWLRRGLKVRSRFGESLLSSLFTKVWFTRTPLLAAADVIVHSIVGYFVGLVFAYSTVPHPRLSGGHLSPLSVVLVIAGGGGGGGEIDLFNLVVALLALIFISMLVGALVMTIHKVSIMAFVRLVSVRATRAAAPGAAKGAVKELVIIIVEERDLQWSAIGTSALKGAIVGVIVAALAEVYPVLR